MLCYLRYVVLSVLCIKLLRECKVLVKDIEH